MISVILYILSQSTTMLSIHNLTIEEVRQNYQLAVSNKNICRSMISSLENNPRSAVEQAYCGAFQAIWANHTSNLGEKLSTFNKGKKNIDAAAERSPKDIEIKFIRLSIQKSSPSLLGYKDKMKEDRSFILNNKQKITSTLLSTMIDNLLKQ
ncbi:MAG TPA: hypothetical protein PK076_05790 [Saprospiraceae bacterium]|nr:hypothetical protein [Saprospiraceae bacterium]